jgi:hypothetical protein
MFHIALYYNPKLAAYTASEKHKITCMAQELMNNDKPINKSKALLVLTLICLVPTVVLYFNSGIQIAISWFAVSALGLEIKMASKNSPLIELYLDNACDAFENDKSAVC